MANYLCKNFSPMHYPLATIHPLQTDTWTTTHANSSTFTKVRSAKTHCRLDFMVTTNKKFVS